VYLQEPECYNDFKNYKMAAVDTAAANYEL